MGRTTNWMMIPDDAESIGPAVAWIATGPIDTSLDLRALVVG